VALTAGQSFEGIIVVGGSARPVAGGQYFAPDTLRLTPDGVFLEWPQQLFSSRTRGFAVIRRSLFGSGRRNTGMPAACICRSVRWSLVQKMLQDGPSCTSGAQGCERFDQNGR